MIGHCLLGYFGYLVWFVCFVLRWVLLLTGGVISGVIVHCFYCCLILLNIFEFIVYLIDFAVWSFRFTVVYVC